MRFHIARLGLLLIIFGLAVMGATIANDSRGHMLGRESFDMQPQGRIGRTFYPVIRTLTVTVESSPDFRGKLYILSERSFRLWRTGDVLDPLVTVDIYGGVSTIFDPPVRGCYGFVIVNDLSETRGVTFRLSDYGWEYDLLAASGVLVSIGSILIVVGIVMKVTFPKRGEVHED